MSTNCQKLLLQGLHAVLLTALAVLLTAPAWADWPQWRGPSRDLIVDAPRLESGRFNLEVRWRQSLGSGYSAVSIVGQRAVTAYSDGENDYVIALDTENGEEVWRYPLGPTFTTDRGSEPGPAGTPTIHAGLVFFQAPTGKLLALALNDGQRVWSQDMAAEGARLPAFGFSSSPLVVDDVLVVQTGVPGAAVSGLEPATGQRLWGVGDDTIGNQSPILWKPGVVLAVTDNFLLGIRAGNGELLWKHPIQMQEIGWSQPVKTNDDGVLLFDGARAVQYRIQDLKTVEKSWESAVVRPNYVTPIALDNVLVGFRGNFMTAFDAATGDELWQSRPPGLSGLILAGGHLVSLGARGDLVVAKPSREGYEEIARLKVSDRSSLVPPSYADNAFFVRNRREVVRVDVVGGEPPQAAPPPSVPGEFGEFLRSLAPEERQETVGQFLAQQQRFPLMERGGIVHLVYWGQATDVAVVGNLPGDGYEQSMHRFADTDLFVLSYKLPEGTHWEYRFNVDHGNYIPDPLHEDRIGLEGQERSRLRMPGWVEPHHLGEHDHHAEGRLVEAVLKSEILEDERKMQVYLPPGYNDSDKRYPLLIVHNGDLALELGQMKNSLDHLIGDSVAELIAVFLPQVSAQEYAGRATENYVRMLAEELVPFLDKNYLTIPKREARGLLGTASGGHAAAYAALRYPDVFSRVASQSFVSRWYANEPLLKLIEESEKEDLTFYVEWSSNDYRNGVWDFNAHKEMLRFVTALRAKGYEPTAVELVDGAGWGSWRARNDAVLEAIFPRTKNP